MNYEIWRETLFDANKDCEIRGTIVLSDLQRRAFLGPVDYLTPVVGIVESPQVVLPDNVEVLDERHQNQYNGIFENRQNSKSSGVITKTQIPWKNVVSPSQWGKKVGIMMVAISMFGLMYAGLPVAIAEVGSSLNKIGESRVASIDAISSHVIVPSPSPLYPVLNEGSNFSADDLYRYKDFRLVIPKIGLESVVIKNVDPNNPSLYGEQLVNGVAHALGSYLPGEDGTMFLFAHSTDAEFNVAKYNAKFYAVRKLEVGDEIMVRYGDKIYKYSVKEKAVISPGELDKIRNSGYKLVLSTCYPPGTDWQRLVVFADPVVDN